MSPWFRVFGRDATEPTSARLLEHLEEIGLPMAGEFRADDLGWYQGELSAAGSQVELQRYVASEADIRSELNAWAAWLETQAREPNHASLMERMIATQQVFTIRGPERVSEALCRFLARVSDGVYQIDGRGFFAAEGTLLLEEDESDGCLREIPAS